jgi:RNA polymerase sigma factor (sigma-70 family)
MRREPLAVALRQIRQVLEELGDAELLTRYVDAGDGEAFAALVKRHGRMVLGVCHRVLRNQTDAEDAFQATFLVLARKAKAVRPRHLVGNWLYGVAHRTALEARRAATVRRARERRAAEMADDSSNSDDLADLRQILDAELSLLPEKYRAPVVLCDLEGLSRREAAVRLGWSEGTLSSRLFRARALLARRLSRFGLAISGGLLAALLPEVSAAPSAALLDSTVGASLGQSAVGAAARALTEGVMKAMLLAKLKMLAAGLTAVFLVAGAGTVCCWFLSESSAEEVQTKPRPGPGPGRAESEVERLTRERDQLRKELEEARALALSQKKRIDDMARALDLALLKLEEVQGKEADRGKPAAKKSIEPDRFDAFNSRQFAEYRKEVADLRERVSRLEVALAGRGSNSTPALSGSLFGGSARPGTALAKPEEAGGNVVRVYSVGDLVVEPNSGVELRNLLTQMIAPQTWVETGGTGSVAYYSLKKVLIVSQTPEVQQKIEAFLQLLRQETKRSYDFREKKS